MLTADVCRQIESHFCCIDGTTYTFALHSVAKLPGRPGYAVLQIGASRLNAVGPPALTANMRVTAALDDLPRVPSLLDSALQQWLFATAPAGPLVH